MNLHRHNTKQAGKVWHVKNCLPVIFRLLATGTALFYTYFRVPTQQQQRYKNFYIAATTEALLCHVYLMFGATLCALNVCQSIICLTYNGTNELKPMTLRAEAVMTFMTIHKGLRRL